MKPVLNISETNGNAFAVLGRAKRVARQHDLDWTTIQSEATSGDYNHLLQTLMKYFEVE